jgi:hypothetical protein
MSLNSLQDNMSRRAASMAAMAKRASRPDEIQAIQKSLITGVQSGAIQPYVGIPLIQELTKKLTEVKAKMAQSIAGAGMPQPPQGGPPIAQQIMAQASQMDQSQGVEALQSNLPQSYAGGGIIAFEDGGQVERYQNAGYTGESERKRAEEAMAKLRTYGLRQRQQDPQGYAAAEQESKQAQEALFNIERSITGGPAGVMGQSMGIATPLAVAPTATPAATPYDPATATRRLMFEGQGQAQPLAPAAPAAPGIGGGGFKPPTLGGMKETTAPTLVDYDSITKSLPKSLQDVSEKAVKATQSQLEEFDKPLDAKGARVEGREAQLAKDSEISRYLAVIKGGLATMGGTSKSAAENIGKGFGVGIDEAIRGEAANRAAKERLEDYRDRLDDQKIAAKKGNFQAAQQAGQRASDDLRQATQMTMTGAHYGNTEALNRFQTQQQGNFQQASLDQAGKLGIAGLEMQNKQLNQTGAFQAKQLEAMEKRYAAMDKQSQARMAQVRAGAVGKFMETVAPQLNSQFTKEIGPNWRTGTDPRSLQAQMLFKQQQNAYIMDVLGQYDSSSSARDSSDL